MASAEIGMGGFQVKLYSTTELHSGENREDRVGREDGEKPTLGRSSSHTVNGNSGCISNIHQNDVNQTVSSSRTSISINEIDTNGSQKREFWSDDDLNNNSTRNNDSDVKKVMNASGISISRKTLLSLPAISVQLSVLQISTMGRFICK